MLRSPKSYKDQQVKYEIMEKKKREEEDTKAWSE